MAGFVGTAGADTLTGSSDDDVLQGLAGRDRLLGGPGADTLDGGADSDVLVGDLGSDRLLGGEGGDTMFGGAGDDFIDGGAGVPDETPWSWYLSTQFESADAASYQQSAAGVVVSLAVAGA